MRNWKLVQFNGVAFGGGVGGRWTLEKENNTKQRGEYNDFELGQCVEQTRA